MRRLFIFILTLLLTFVGIKAQDLPDSPPYQLDRAISVWARNLINANTTSIFGQADSSRIIFNYRDSTITILRYVDFDLENGWTQQEGRVGWNDDDKTLEVGLDQGSVLQMGQEIHVRGVNKHGTTLYNGTPVFISGAQGSRPTFGRARDTSILTSLTTIGLATQDIENSTNGYVAITGIVRDIPDSMFITSDAITDGELLWLGDGLLSDLRPDASNTQVAFGFVLNTQGSTVDVIIDPVLGQRLAFLSDVAARGNQATNDLLVWQDSMWIHRDSLAINTIEYTDTYWDDLRVPLTNTRINPANSEPDFEDRGDGLFAWGFDSDADSTHVLNFTAQGSHTRADSTTEDGHFHWQPDGTNTGSVLWRLIYSMANEQSDWTPVDTLWALDAADGVALKHQLIDFGLLVGSDTMRISHAIVGNVCRVGEDSRDTYTGTAFGIELDFHYQINSPGSKEENSKY